MKVSLTLSLCVSLSLFSNSFKFDVYPASPPPILVTELQGSEKESSLAFNGKNDAVIVWRQASGAHNVYAAFLPRGSASWQQQTTLWDEDVTGSPGFNPIVAMNSKGFGVIAWEVSNEIYTKTFRIKDQMVFSSSQKVSSIENGSASSPQTVITEEGTVLLIWKNQISSSYGVIDGAFLQAGSTAWIPIENILASEGGHYIADGPSMVINLKNQGVICCRFYDSSSPYSQIFSTRFKVSSSGAVFDPILVVSQKETGQANVVAGIDERGNISAAWRDTNASPHETIVFANLYTGSSSWAPATTISNTDNLGYNAKLSMNEKGRGVVVWQESPSSENTSPCYVFSMIMNLNNTGSETHQIYPISLVEGDRGRTPNVVVDKAGNAVAAWFHDDNSDVNTYANIAFLPYSPVLTNNNQAWQQQQPLSVLGSDSGESVRLAINANGIGGAAWANHDDGTAGGGIPFDLFFVQIPLIQKSLKYTRVKTQTSTSP